MGRMRLALTSLSRPLLSSLSRTSAKTPLSCFRHAQVTLSTVSGTTPKTDPTFTSAFVDELPRLSSTETIDGRRVVRQIGLVTASSVRTKNLFFDLLAALRGVVGGESVLYTRLLNETTAEATKRMLEVAKEQGATSVVRVRYETTTTMNRLIVGLHVSCLAYGTAIIDEEEPARYRGGGLR